MFITTEATTYRSVDGSEIIMPKGSVFGEMLFSPDGVTFYDMNAGGGLTSYPKFDMQVGSIHFHTLGQLVGDDQQLSFNGQPYTRVNNEEREVFVVPKPGHRVVEYIFTDIHGTYYFVDRPEYDWDYNKFRLFVGDGERMRQVPVSHVSRFRDGGTTIIETDEGILYSPTPFKKDKPATWDKDVVLMRQNSDDFRVTWHFSGTSDIFGGVTLRKLS